MTSNNRMTHKHIPLGKGVTVLKEDELGLIALEKPAGIKSHPNSVELERGCLVQAKYDVQRECYFWKTVKEGEPAVEERLYLLNRLDSPTSGIILVTFFKAVAETIRELYKTRHVHKTYHAIVKGQPKQISLTWTDHLERTRTEKRGHLRVQKGGHSTAITKVKLEKRDHNGIGISLLRLEPQTGRTHQLRVQSALRHQPIIGDKTYGDFKLNRAIEKAVEQKRLYLHATALSLEYQLSGKTSLFEVECALPESFSVLMDSNARIRQQLLSIKPLV